MPRPSLDEIFQETSAPVPLYQPANENERNAAIADIYEPKDNRPSLDDIFAQSKSKAQQVSQQPDNRILADEPGYEYGGILPFKKNVSTGENSFAWPEAVRSPVRGIQDLENMASSGQVSTGQPNMTPDSINAMATMFFPFASKENELSGMAPSRDQPQPPPPPTPSSQQLRELSSPMFEQAKQSSTALIPDAANTFADKAKMLTPQTEGEKIVFGRPSPAEEVANSIQGLRDRPLTLAETQGIDSRLGQLAEDHFDKVKGDYDSEGIKYLQLQQHLRDTWNDVKESDVVGGKEAYNQVVKARDLWAAQSRMADVERLEKRAALSENPQTVIKNGAKQILRNSHGLTDDEIVAWEAANKTGILGSALKIASSKAVDAIIGGIAGMTGGISGAILGGTIGHVVGKGATSLRNKLQSSRLANVKDVIAQRPSVQSAIQNPSYPPVGFNQ